VHVEIRQCELRQQTNACRLQAGPGDARIQSSVFAELSDQEGEQLYVQIAKRQRSLGKSTRVVVDNCLVAVPSGVRR
jgi:hypothetical protein